MDWLRNLRIVLKAEQIAYVLDGLLPDPLVVDVSGEDQRAHLKHLEDTEIARCIMLASMTPELRKLHEVMDAYTMIYHLTELFDEQARFERFETSKMLFCTKMVDGTSLVSHTLKMNGYI